MSLNAVFPPSPQLLTFDWIVFHLIILSDCVLILWNPLPRLDFVSQRSHFYVRLTITWNSVRHPLHSTLGSRTWIKNAWKIFPEVFSRPTTDLLDPNWRDDSHYRLDVGLVFVLDFKLFRSPDKTRSDPSGRDRPARSLPHSSQLTPEIKWSGEGLRERSFPNWGGN